MIHLFGEMISLLGFEAIVSSDGRSGLSLIQSQQPDLVLLDIMMPDMNGWQVYEELRTFSTVPVIFLTADFSSGNQLRAESIGASLLKKNITPFELRDAMHAELEG